MKRTTPNVFVRIYCGWAVGLSVILGICTVGGLYFALSPPQNITDKQKILAMFGLLLLGVSSAYIRGRQRFLPDTFIDELSRENNYSILYCDQKSLREADEMTKPFFGRDFIPFDQIEQWRIRNNKGFVQINNSDGTLCACFVILGLERSFLDQFVAGRLTEHDIDSNVILSFDDMKKEERIYISGVVVRNPHTHMGHKRAVVMVWAMLQYIKKTFGLRKPRTFYAVALTNESERLLRTMEFTLCGNKEGRKDKSNLYRIDLDKLKWEKLICRIGDFSKMTSIEYND